MSLRLIQSPILVVLCSFLFIALVAMITRRIILPLLGIRWPDRAVRAPWRFSLLALTVLIVLAGVVFGLFRDAPNAALIALTMLATVWFTTVRYLSFRRLLADRSRRELALTLQSHHDEKSDRQ